MHVLLREVTDDDLPVFYRYSTEPDGIRMAAFTAEDPADRARFDAHWARLRHDPSVLVLTVVGDGDVVGNVGVFGLPGEREITYWIGQAYWGRGVATAAVRELLGVVPERPLRARAAADNRGSIRVLEKCGFVLTGHERGFANARGGEIDEVVLTLDGGSAGTR